MSCKLHSHQATRETQSRGGHEVCKKPEPLITYKYLKVNEQREFVSPLAETKWHNLSASGQARDRYLASEWVWSCTTPDNPELQGYRSLSTVLVTLQVWGKVLIGDNGVVQSEHARIIQYDANDYYGALATIGVIPLQEALDIIDPQSPRFVELIKQNLGKLTAQELEKILVEKKQDVWVSYPRALEKFTEQKLRELLEKSQSPQLAYAIASRIKNTIPLDYLRPFVCRSPIIAFQFAKFIEGAHNSTRQAACKDPAYAYQYARYIDRAPRDDTRLAACQDPQYAYYYATDIDHRPDLATREAVCQSPQFARLYAQNVDRCGTEITRKAASQDPREALEYALNVDQAPHPTTRLGVLVDPDSALRYAIEIDQKPLDETRLATSQKPSTAYYYALYVDRSPCDITRRGASTDPQYAYLYARSVDRSPHPITRTGASKSAKWGYQYAVSVDRMPTEETRKAVQSSKAYRSLYQRWENKLVKTEVPS